MNGIDRKSAARLLLWAGLAGALGVVLVLRPPPDDWLAADFQRLLPPVSVSAASAPASAAEAAASATAGPAASPPATTAPATAIPAASGSPYLSFPHWAAQLAAEQAATAYERQLLLLAQGPGAEDFLAMAEAELAAAGYAEPDFEARQAARWREAGERLHPYRANLASPAARQRLREDPQAYLESFRALLHSPLGSRYWNDLPEDPLGLYQDFLAANLPEPNPAQGGAHLAHVQVPEERLGFNAAAGLYPLYRELAARAEEGGIKFHAVGAPLYTAYGAGSARREISTIGAASLAALSLLLWFALRSPAGLALAFLTVAAGLAGGLAFALLICREIHALAIAFGATLIGIAADYAFHYLCHSLLPGWRPEAGLRRVFKGLALGAASSFAGFSALALLPFPGLRQIGVFMAGGLLCSFATVCLLFPALYRGVPGKSGGGETGTKTPDNYPPPAQLQAPAAGEEPPLFRYNHEPNKESFVGGAIIRGFRAFFSARPADAMVPNNAVLDITTKAGAKQAAREACLPVLLCGLLAGLAATGMSEGGPPNDDVRSFYAAPGDLVAGQAAAARILGHGDDSRFLLLRAGSEEELLQLEERTVAAVPGLRAGASALAPSAASQRETRELLRALLADGSLAAHFEALGLPAAALAPYAASIEAPFKPVRLEILRGVFPPSPPEPPMPPAAHRPPETSPHSSPPLETSPLIGDPSDSSLPPETSPPNSPGSSPLSGAMPPAAPPMFLGTGGFLGCADGVCASWLGLSGLDDGGDGAGAVGSSRLSNPPASPAPTIPALDAALAAEPGMRVVDPIGDINAALADYREYAALILLAAGLLAGAVLAVHLGLAAALKIMVLPVAACLFSFGLLRYWQETYSLVHLLALLPVAGVGLDFAIFRRITPLESQGATRLAIALSAITSILAFGMLSLSATPAISDFGKTIGLGLLFAWFFSAMTRPPAEKRPRKK